MNFTFATCPRTKTLSTLMSNRNNPLAQEVSFEYISTIINVHNIHDAEFFCRTYNIAFMPDVWIKMADSIPLPSKMIETYAAAMFDERNNALDGQTGEYVDRAHLTFEAINNLWAKTLKQRDILLRLKPLQDDFVARERINWGDQYDFNDLIKLSDLYIQSLKANSITNPIQKESLRVLLKTLIDINRAIVTKDTAELKSLTAAFSTMAKTAQLDNMIEDTHTDELSTLAEIAQIVEDSGFEMPYYDGADRDAIDIAIHDIEESNARLVKTATGLGPQIEQMMQKYREEQAQQADQAAQEEVDISSLLSAYETEQNIEEEPDDFITDMKFDETEGN